MDIPQNIDSEKCNKFYWRKGNRWLNKFENHQYYRRKQISDCMVPLLIYKEFPWGGCPM